MNGRHTESYVAGLVQEFPLDRTPFEARLAAERIPGDDVLRLLDHETFFDLLGLPRLTGVEAVLTALDQDRLIARCDADGWDTIDAVEHQHLPPPLFEIPPGSTRVVLFSHRDLRDVDSRMRIRAVYQHACRRYVQRDFLTNTSLRERFGIEANNRAWVSRLIKAATEVGVIAPFDTDAGPKAMRYVPWWAAEGRG